MFSGFKEPAPITLNLLSSLPKALLQKMYALAALEYFQHDCITTNYLHQIIYKINTDQNHIRNGGISSIKIRPYSLEVQCIFDYLKLTQSYFDLIHKQTTENALNMFNIFPVGKLACFAVLGGSVLFLQTLFIVSLRSHLGRCLFVF